MTVLIAVNIDNLFLSLTDAKPSMPTLVPSPAPSMAWPTTQVAPSNGPINTFSAVAVSNDGSVITFGNDDGTFLYSRQSANDAFQATNTTHGSDKPPFSSLSMSLNGQYQFAACGEQFAYISDNFGSSWELTTSGLSNSVNAFWVYSAMSDDGYTILASNKLGQMALYKGESSGTWSPVFSLLPALPEQMKVIGIAMDKGGVTFVFMNEKGRLFISNNLGSTWFKSQGGLANSYQHVPATFTASRGNNLQTIIAGAADINELYVSTDQGNTWQIIYSPPNTDPTNVWRSLAISYDGKYVVGIQTNGPASPITGQEGLYYSSNSGLNWEFMYPVSKTGITTLTPAGNTLFVASAFSNVMHSYQQAGKCMCVFPLFFHH
jgi:photosystem II stability/assembly factor-like uncharacterized protein